MPGSFFWGKQDVGTYIARMLKQNSTLRVLDIGCGSGNYGKLLYRFKGQVDGIEVFEPNIRKFKLREIYNSVYSCNALGFNFYDDYNIFILGDILEHLTPKDARELLDTLKNSQNCGLIVVAVPFLYEQDEIDSNKYEIHLQPDLTLEVMKERYPELNLFIHFPQVRNGYAYYTWSPTDYLKKKNTTFYFTKSCVEENGC